MIRRAGKNRLKTICNRVSLGVIASAGLALSSCAQTPAPIASVDEIRGPEDEIIYFVLPDRFENADASNDRGALEGDRLETGYDPTNNGFFHGGDLEGLTKRLDYIQGLGATAVWLSPVFKNKPVQGPSGIESAGYHGYWITDFTSVDPHLGSNEDFKTFVDAAHARGMRVYMDIITNHTADVIKYVECHGPDAPDELRSRGECPYRSVGEYPYTTRGEVDAAAINEGFLGDDPAHLTTENFARLTDPNFAYDVFIPDEEKDAKTPAWLNDPIYYHNRGHTTFRGEDSRYGDFGGLDDLMTEHPRVVRGMIDIYKQWISDYRIDGYRIDTAKHVNPEFWLKLIPELEAHAEAEGVPHFHIFGEAYEPDGGHLSVYTRRDGLPTVLDFAFQSAATSFIASDAPGESMARFFELDHNYASSAQMGRRLPTFLGNHDMGRFAGMVRQSRPDASGEEVLARTRLAHALMMFSRGVPTIYYGDEQGFVSDGGDRGAREDMFASQTPDYNDNDLLGTDATTADVNFDRAHPLYKAIAEMAAIRSDHKAFRRGEQRVRLADLEDSTLVLSRFDPDGVYEYVVAFNAETIPETLSFAVDGRARAWESLAGSCPKASPAPGVLSIEAPALNYVICRAHLGGAQ